MVAASAAIGQAGTAFAEDRTLSMYEIHTKETISVTYMRDGVYDEEALKQLNHFMRDWRSDEPTTMDRELIDLIWTLHHELGSQEAIHLISGYRSKKTNEKLRRAGGGQARRSQHTLGRASDIHFPDVPVKKLRASALVQEVGGVGYYPTSGIPFVHVDTGRVRMWPRMPRLELAALFPSGKTGYMPRDGRPITKKDYQLALAKGMVSKTLVASAAPGLAPMPTPSPQRMMMAEAAQPVLASAALDEYKPMTLGPASEPLPEEPKRFAVASAGGGLPFARASLRPTQVRHPIPAQATSQAAEPSLAPSTPPVSAQQKAPTPAYQRATVVSAPAFDDDHPDELSYVPFETASLMTDKSVAEDREIVPLTHPEQHDLDYLFDDMDQPSQFELRRTSGYLGLASVQTLSGQAVRSLYAGLPKRGPTRLANAR